MIFHVPMSERAFFQIYGGGIAERIHSKVFVETEDDSWVRLWACMVTIRRLISDHKRTPDFVSAYDRGLLLGYQRAAIGLALALNDAQ
jgi:hypothetical protein